MENEIEINNEDVLKEPMCSFFNRMYDTTNSEKSVPSILNAIKTGIMGNEDFSNLILQIRKELNVEEKRKKKGKLMAVTFGAVFESSRRSALLMSNGLIVLDFDHVEAVLQVKTAICEMPYIYACFISPSGDGLKVLVRTNCKDSLEYKSFIIELFDEFNYCWALKADPSKKGINDLCYLSHDPDIYINEKAALWKRPDEGDFSISKSINPKGPANGPKNPVASGSFVQNDDEALIIDLVIQAEVKEVDITAKYQSWLKIGFAIANAMGENGREYYHRFSCFYPKYDRKETDQQYSSCLKNNRGDVNLGTLVFLAAEFGMKSSRNSESTVDEQNFSFWERNSKTGEYKVNASDFYDFLHENGFRKYYAGKNSVPFVIRMQNNILSKVNEDFLVTFCRAYIENLTVSKRMKRDLRNALYRNSTLLSKANLLTLKTFEGKLKRDCKDTAFLYFKNGMCQIGSDSMTFYPYEKQEECLWESQIIDKDFNEVPESEVIEKSEFYTFLVDISRDEELRPSLNRYDSIISILGYLLHDFKNPASAKAVIFSDYEQSEEANGGKGKGIVKNAISYIKKTANENGKIFKPDSDFIFSQVEHDVRILVIDDAPISFNFERLFSVITDGITVNRKYENKSYISFEDSPKFLITTNYVILGEGESHERRKVEFEFSAFYSQDRTPEQTFNHLLFIDWDEEQWNLFYNFMAYCIRRHLKSGLIQAPSVNSALKKLRASAGDGFIEFVRGNVVLGQKLNKTLLFNQYCAENKFDKQFKSKRTFTIWLRLYARAFDLKMLEPKSGSDYSFIYTAA
jgi:hypothetical protein